MKKIAESNSLLNVLCLEDVLKDLELLNEILVDADFQVKFVCQVQLAKKNS
jgi:hypothetical protein